MDVYDLIQKGKIKRYFRSRNKISFPGAISHITQRAPGREKLFIEDKDYFMMLHVIKAAVKKYNLSFFSFVLMPNHVHFLFQLNKNNLSGSLQYIFNNYAFYFNKKYERKGHVFCDRFRQALCCDETYLLASSVYIHANPIVAGLAKNISTYRWSSIAPFLHKVDKKPFIKYKLILQILSEDITSARQMYKDLLHRSIKLKAGNLWDNAKAMDVFRDKLIDPLRKVMSSSKRFDPILSIESEIDDILTKKYHKNHAATAARVYLIQQLQAKGYSISEIARKLSLTRQAIYKTLKSG